MKASIIYNPNATGMSEDALKSMNMTLKKQGADVLEFESRYPGHVVELMKKANFDNDLVITMGGDGTLGEAFRALGECEQKAFLAHISTGTANDTANNLGLYQGSIYSSIKLKRCFPMQNPNEYIVVSYGEDNQELGIIKNLNELNKQDITIANLELKERYFLPIITNITKLRQKRDFVYFNLITNCGEKQIVVQNIAFSINSYQNGQIIMKDVDNNYYCFDNEYLKSKNKNAKFIRNYI